MQFNNLNDDYSYLFDCDFFDESFDPEDHEDHLDFSIEFLQHYIWEDIYDLFFKKITSTCDTVSSIYNYINLFYYYGFTEKPINDPYKLIGYVLYKINLEKEWDLYSDFIDSFFISILENSCGLDLQNDPYYQPWKDEKVIESVNEWKNMN